MEHPAGKSWDEWVDLRFEELEKRSEAARREMERRLETMNEFREQLNKQAATFITRDIYESRHQTLCDHIHNLERLQAAAEARGKVYSVVVAALTSILVALIVYFITGR